MAYRQWKGGSVSISKRDAAEPFVRDRARSKQPYEAPRIIYEDAVETMAASCNTNPGGKDDPTCLVGFT